MNRRRRSAKKRAWIRAHGEVDQHPACVRSTRPQRTVPSQNIMAVSRPSLRKGADPQRINSISIPTLEPARSFAGLPPSRRAGHSSRFLSCSKPVPIQSFRLSFSLLVRPIKPPSGYCASRHSFRIQSRPGIRTSPSASSNKACTWPAGRARLSASSYPFSLMTSNRNI